MYLSFYAYVHTKKIAYIYACIAVLLKYRKKPLANGKTHSMTHFKVRSTPKQHLSNQTLDFSISFQLFFNLHFTFFKLDGNDKNSGIQSQYC